MRMCGGTTTSLSTWKPTLVILRINRAATSVKWSPNGAKFAVGSGAKMRSCVPLRAVQRLVDLSNDQEAQVDRVCRLAFSPNGKFIVTGGADMKCRVFSAFMEGIDSDNGRRIRRNVAGSARVRRNVGGVRRRSRLGPRRRLVAEAGHRIAFATHGEHHSLRTTLRNANGADHSIVKDMPYLDMLYATDDTLVAAGFQGNIDVYSASGGKWAYKDKLDKKATSATAVVSFWY